MTTENQPPSESNGKVDGIIADAFANVPPASAPVPDQQTTETPTPDNTTPELGVPAPDQIVESSTPPAEVPVPPLSPDAVALRDKQEQIDALTAANQQTQTLLERYQTQQRQSEISQTTDKFAQQLVNDGLTAERANQYGQFLANAQVQGQDAARETAAKTQTANNFATQYGVPVETLMMHGTPQAMEAAAKQEQRIMGLEKQLTQTRQGQLPTQVFATESGLSTGMTEAQKSAASGRGEYKYTPEEEAQRRTAALAKIGR